jgi:hypothetical protein
MEENKTAQCRSGNLCVVELRLEDEDVVSQKSYSVGNCLNRTTCDYSSTGVRGVSRGFTSQVRRGFGEINQVRYLFNRRSHGPAEKKS